MTSLQEFKEVVKYTVTTGDFLRKKRKKKKVWSWAGNICFYPRVIFEFQILFPVIDWRKKSIAEILFFFFILESDNLSGSNIMYILYIYLCVKVWCVHIHMYSIIFLLLQQDHATISGSWVQSHAANTSKKEAGRRGRASGRRNRMLQGQEGGLRYCLLPVEIWVILRAAWCRNLTWSWVHHSEKDPFWSPLVYQRDICLLVLH